MVCPKSPVGIPGSKCVCMCVIFNKLLNMLISFLPLYSSRFYQSVCHSDVKINVHIKMRTCSIYFKFLELFIRISISL